ncbi:MAG: purine-nucleoside phosphorylase [Bacteroidales bacterium]|nr:purine-nucleoside phosphorylase [Bacteroidales bacterium]MBN2820633.1 purine-nucleoside phosphorylase [Bacteroidales bacterium]
MLKKIQETVEFITKQLDFKPQIGIILGSGLGDFIKSVEIKGELLYSEIPHFPVTSVDGHEGKLLHAEYAGKQILIMQGRIHYYEGTAMEQLTYPVRIMKFLGVEFLFLSNASGGMNENFKVGDVMILTDHINLMPNPLIGKHYPEFGERFPDMSDPYDKDLIEKAEVIAQQKNIKVHKGVYVAVTGPTYETPAEYKFFRIIGGDAVGMSTVPEVILARQIGIKCFALSVITDLGIPGQIEFLTHEMVQEAAAKAEPRMAGIVLGLIEKV